MTCKGICHRYKALKPLHGKIRYAQGQKRCIRCDVYIKWDGLFCPCCGSRLRVAPRHTKLKEKALNFSRI
ncbi:MAG: hypothetical protein NPMRTH1_520002 [Nitrosopumilales archaeon]|nr:MAG: hypothetical protein NPMRTH1_520002 [Nitrosopumilales archaeon]